MFRLVPLRVSCRTHPSYISDRTSYLPAEFEPSSTMTTPLARCVRVLEEGSQKRLKGALRKTKPEKS